MRAAAALSQDAGRVTGGQADGWIWLMVRLLAWLLPPGRSDRPVGRCTGRVAVRQRYASGESRSSAKRPRREARDPKAV